MGLDDWFGSDSGEYVLHFAILERFRHDEVDCVGGARRLPVAPVLNAPAWRCFVVTCIQSVDKTKASEVSLSRLSRLSRLG